MDSMVINSKLMRGVASKVLNGVVKKQTGYKVSTQLNELTIHVMDDQAIVHLNIDTEMTRDELGKLLTGFGLG